MKNMSSTLVETVSIDYEDFNESFLTCGTCLCKYSFIIYFKISWKCNISYILINFFKNSWNVHIFKKIGIQDFLYILRNYTRSEKILIYWFFFHFSKKWMEEKQVRLLFVPKVTYVFWFFFFFYSLMLCNVPSTFLKGKN